MTESVAYRRLLLPEALWQLNPHRGLLVYGHRPPVRIWLQPRFRARRLVALAMAVDAATCASSPSSTLFGPAGRRWLTELQLPAGRSVGWTPAYG